MPRFLRRFLIWLASGQMRVSEMSASLILEGSSLFPAPMLDATFRPRFTLSATSATLQLSESMASIT